MRSIDLRERDRTVGVALSASEARTLTTANAGLRLLARAEPGIYDVEASQWVGTIVGPSFRAFIRPKVAIQRLFYLLTFSSDLPRLLPESALGEARDLLS